MARQTGTVVGIKTGKGPVTPPMSTVAVFPVGTLTVPPPSSASEGSKAEPEADSVRTDPARPGPVASVSYPPPPTLLRG